AHEGATHYENLDLTVSGGGASTNLCRKPILSFSEFDTANPLQPKVRLYWSAQPGLTVWPEWSANLAAWTAMTNTSGGPLSVTTPPGSIQWLEAARPNGLGQMFFRLRVD